MKQTTELAKRLLTYPNINRQVKKIITIQDQIKTEIKKNPNLIWTNNQMRAFLENKILAQKPLQGLPTRIIATVRYEIQTRLDLLLPLSIGIYRPQDWKETYLLIDYIYENVIKTPWEKRWNFKSFKDLKEEFKAKITYNQKILAAAPLTKSEVRDFEKRLIYFKSGGINNIKNIQIVELKSEIKGRLVNQKFLALEVKNPDDCQTEHLYNANWQEVFSFENIQYQYPLETHSFIKRPTKVGFEGYHDWIKLKKLMDDKFKKNNTLLFLIKNDDTDLIAINDFINNWKKDNLSLEAKALRTFVNNQFNNEGIPAIYNEFKTKALNLCTLQNNLVLMQNDLELKMISKKIFTSKPKAIDLEINSILDELFYQCRLELENLKINLETN